MNFISINGKIQSEKEPALLASNRGYRYGDGLFETMKLIDARIQLESYHFERLFSGLSILKYAVPKLFTTDRIRDETLQLCKKNKCESLARVRLSVFRGNGGLYDDGQGLEWLIEAWPLDPAMNGFNENGLVTGLYPDAQKSCDRFSNLKSANALIYSMAAVHAKEMQWNDALVMNTQGNIADSSIANIFIVKNDEIITPSLSEGCVNGVMRRMLMEKMRDTGSGIRNAGYVIREEPITVPDLLTADEIFLTNAIRGIRWVRQFEDKIYTNKTSLELSSRFLTLFVE